MTTKKSNLSPAYESGLDWLTLTAPAKSDAAVELASWCNAQQEIEHAQGEKAVDTSPQGYKGRRCGSTFFGVGRYGWLFQISGVKSNDALNLCKGLPNDFKCTRTDYRTDQRFNETDRRFTDRMRRIIRSSEKREGAKEAVAIVHHEDFRRGCSLLVGSRSSGSYLRIYDKYSESGYQTIENLWRFELETKKELSKNSWPQLLACDDVPQLCRSVVSRKMKAHGLPVPFSVEAPELRLASQQRKTNDQRRVEWFLYQVLPTVDKISDPKLRQEMKDAFWLRFNAL